MPTSPPRQQVIDALAELTPADYRVLPYERGIDRPEKTTVLVELRRVVPNPDVPSARNYTFDLAIVSPRRDLDKLAGDELDAALLVLLAAVDDAPMLLWTEAERGQYKPLDLPAYVVTVVATDK